MGNRRIVIVTEANEKVATGHLMECIDCAGTLLSSGFEVSFWINRDAKMELKKRIPCAYQEYCAEIENDCERLTEDMNGGNIDIGVFNLRQISGDFVAKLKTMTSARIICIDEYGHRYLPADVIINPMIDPYYWQYETEAELYCGAQYLFLAKEVNLFHQMEKQINENVGNILISMGGVDPRNYTALLIEELPACFPEAHVSVVIGGGNLNRSEIYKMVHGDKISIYENISNMPEMIYQADLIVCAGGNTLHEAACIGTPAVVFPSMPHEVRTAQCFASEGFGYVIDIHENLRNELNKACNYVKDSCVRKRMSDSGRALSDGLGVNRVVDIIRKCVI